MRARHDAHDPDSAAPERRVIRGQATRKVARITIAKPGANILSLRMLALHARTFRQQLVALDRHGQFNVVLRITGVSGFGRSMIAFCSSPRSLANS